ncbi:MAG: ATP-binding protein [Jatrophihabitantaceae bacterium]
MCLQDQRTYPCEPASPGHARAYCREHLGPVMGHVADGREVVSTTELVITELMTNAINAGCSGEITLELALHHNHLQVSVQDNAPGQPRVKQPSASNEHGRGLHIVATLATSWGVVPVVGGKQVWADLAVPAAATAALSCARRGNH